MCNVTDQFIGNKLILLIINGNKLVNLTNLSFITIDQNVYGPSILGQMCDVQGITLN